LIGVVYLATLREGHRWGDDFALYILHAKNIVEGRPYAETGYIFNPDLRRIGPRTYPPVFPLLLAPLYKAYGLNLEAMKVEVVCLFLGSLWLAFLLFRSELSFASQLLLVLGIGLNPYLWNFKENIVSEFPFLFFLYLAFLALQERDQTPALSDRGGTPLGRSLLAGALCCVCYGTRSIGLVLLPCLVIHDFLQYRRLTRRSVVVTVMVLVTVLVINLFVHSDGDYFAPTFHISPDRLLHKVRALAYSVMVLWDNGHSRALQYALLVSAYALALLGFVEKVRRRIDVHDLFAVLYPLVMVPLPQPGQIRYLIPMIPLFVFYIFRGAHVVATRLRLNQALVTAALASAILGTYTLKYSSSDFGPIEKGVTSPTSRALFEYIRKNTRKEDVFIFRKPRALPLFTGRSASYVLAKKDAETFAYLDKIKARYVIVFEVQYDRKYLIPFLARNREKFRLAYSNDRFRMYEFSSEEGTRDKASLRPGASHSPDGMGSRRGA